MHPIPYGEVGGSPLTPIVLGSCFCAPPPISLQGGDMGVLMLPIPYGEMWEGVGGSSDPHLIVGGGGEG